MIRLLLSRGADLNARNNYDRDAEAEAEARYIYNIKNEAAALFADVRLAGGSWHSYVLVPRKRVLALRVLCERGRASTDDDLLRRLFPWHPPAAADDDDDDDADAERPSLLRELPKEVFWLILRYWRSSRDFYE